MKEVIIKEFANTEKACEQGQNLIIPHSYSRKNFSAYFSRRSINNKREKYTKIHRKHKLVINDGLPLLKK